MTISCTQQTLYVRLQRDGSTCVISLRTKNSVPHTLDVLLFATVHIAAAWNVLGHPPEASYDFLYGEEENAIALLAKWGSPLEVPDEALGGSVDWLTDAGFSWEIYQPFRRRSVVCSVCKQTIMI